MNNTPLSYVFAIFTSEGVNCIEVLFKVANCYANWTVLALLLTNKSTLVVYIYY